jgi:hypothetical protein
VLHAYVHALLTHSAVALATPVVQVVPHVLQSLGLLVGSTHVDPQRVGVAAGQPETHVPPWQTGVPPLHAWPQDPQLALFVCSLTQAPLQGENPLLHENPQVLFEHVTVAFATPVVQTLPQVLQSLVLVVRFTHVPPQSPSPHLSP